MSHHIEPEETELTEEQRAQAKENLDYIINRIDVLMRLSEFDNGIKPITREEKLVCLEDALNEINAFPPTTNIKLDYFFTTRGKPQLTMLCWGAIKNLYTLLLADVAVNSIDVTIDEFQISSRMNEFQMLKNEYEQKFLNDLQARKAMMGSIVRGQYRQTSFMGIDGFCSENMRNRYRKTYWTI